MIRFISVCVVFFLSQGLIAGPQHTDFMGAGHSNGVTVTASSSVDKLPQTTVDGFRIQNVEQLKDASRFLAQATFGADYATIEMTAAMGYEAWLEEQFNLPYSSVVDEMLEQGDVPMTDQLYNPWFRAAWITSHLTSPDLLRRRMGFVWSQIMVINDNADFFEDISQFTAHYYDQLALLAFGNFNEMLTHVTFSPAMGLFLSHYNNPKEDPERNIHPDENYAREIMQLFSIGLWELNPDGTRKVNDHGENIPTYDNTAPFICKSLIKLLTTSNPSSKYVYDVASVFDPEEPENFKKVMKAILLHPEARNQVTYEYSFGKLREPLVRLMNLLRAFPMSANSKEDFPMDMFCYGSITGQSPLEVPSVFNFFLPDYQPPGLIEDENLVAPEFHILNSTNSIGTINDLNFRISGDRYMRDYCLEGVYKYEWDIINQLVDENSFVMDFQYELKLADDPPALVDRLDLLLANELLATDTKKIIEEAISQVEDPTESVKMAIYLTMISPDYVILK